MPQPSEIRFENLPEKVQKRLQSTSSEAEQIIEEARSILKTKIDGKISFKYTQRAPTDILSAFERAQSVCFITRYENLPTFKGIELLEHKGKIFLNNISFLRHILNEYRPIIQNKKDSVYYGKIHKFCHEKLMNKDSSKGLCISVEHEKDGNITDAFLDIVNERNKSVKTIIKKCEFGYIYNGILQHSDHKYTKRFWQEYHLGTINHIFIKHAIILDYVKDCLYWHYTILNQLTFPKLGPI